MKTAAPQIAFVETHPGRVSRNGSFVPAVSGAVTCFRSALTRFIVKADSTILVGITGTAGLLYALISGIFNLLLLIS